MNKINVHCIIGKSGSGKSHFINELVGTSPWEYYEVKSYSTRAIREEDKNDKNTHIFVDESFWDKSEGLPVAYYYSPKDYINWTDISSFQKDKVNLYAIDPRAYIELLKDDRFNVKGIYIQVSKETRMARYRAREGNLNYFSRETHLDLSLLDGYPVEVINYDR